MITMQFLDGQFQDDQSPSGQFLDSRRVIEKRGIQRALVKPGTMLILLK